MKIYKLSIQWCEAIIIQLCTYRIQQQRLDDKEGAKLNNGVLDQTLGYPRNHWQWLLCSKKVRKNIILNLKKELRIIIINQYSPGEKSNSLMILSNRKKVIHKQRPAKLKLLLNIHRISNESCDHYCQIFVNKYLKIKIDIRIIFLYHQN